MKKLVLSQNAFLFLSLITITFTTSLNAQVWEQTNGPAGGYIDEIHAGPDNYVFTMSNGLLFRSSNSGDNWEQIEPDNEIVNLVGVDDNGYVFAADTSNLLRSTDYGDTWSPVFTNEFSPAYNLLSAPGDTVYCYGPMLIMSVDNGLSWTIIDSTWTYNVVVNSSGDLIKAEYDQLLISTDQGDTWNLYIDVAFLNTDVTAMDINEQDEIFIGGSWSGIYKIAADGSSWESLEVAFFDIYDIEVTSAGTLYCISYLGNVQVSYDNGESWIGTIEGMVSPVTYYSLTSDPSGIVFVGWHDGIYKSVNDGISWLHANTGINHSSLKELVSVFGEGVYALTDRLVWKSEDQGANWTRVFGTTPFQAISKLINLPDSDLYLIVEDLFIDKSIMIPCIDFTSCQRLMRSEDEGETWNEVLSAAYMSDVVINSSGDLFVSMGDELMKSEDDGLSWEVINLQVHLSNLAVDTADMLYGQSSYGFYISDDEGLNWDSIAPPAYDGLQYIIDLQISNSGVFYSISSTGSTTFLHVSTDGGISWEEVTPVDSLSITDLYIGMYDYVYLSSDSGIFRSQNNGEDWTNISLELSNPSLAVTEDETGVLYADVTGHGVFKSGLFVAVKPISLMSDALKIFPNPATETLNVNYGNAFNGTPVFYIYNIHGKLVQSAPMMSITSVLDISSLIPGFYTIEIQGKTAKFVVVH